MANYPSNTWHDPEFPDKWRTMVSVDTESSQVHTIPSLSSQIPQSVPRPNRWHLPKSEDTIARPVPIDPHDESTLTDEPLDQDTEDLITDVSDQTTTQTFDYANVLSQLSQDSTATASVSSAQLEPAVAQQSTTTTFDYSQVLSELQQTSDSSEFVATESPSPSTQTDPLVQTFIQREQQIRQLRQQRDAGQITHDYYQNQLRELMVLDPQAQCWWVMGVDDDQWYRWNAQIQNWEVATPPHRLSYTPTTPESYTPAPVAHTPTYSSAHPEPARDPQVAVHTPTDHSYTSTPSYAYTSPEDLGSSAGFTPDVNLSEPSSMVTDQEDLALTRVGKAAFANQISTSDVGATQVASPSTTETFKHQAPDENIEVADQIERVQQRQRQNFISGTTAAIIVVVGIILLGIATPLLVGTVWYSNIGNRWQSGIESFGSYEFDFQTVRILDASGNEIAELRSQEGGDRTFVALVDISPYVIHAVVSTEDQRFFTNPGFDLIAIARAFLQNISGGAVISGGSTITQQLARSILFPETEFPTEADRKLNEIVIAAELSRRYSKDAILETYLNQIYFGNQNYGIQAAADFYFNKPAADLNLGEAALIAGLIQAPSLYDPITQPSVAFERLDTVIVLMLEVGCVTVSNQDAPLCINASVLSGPAAVDIARVKNPDQYRPTRLERQSPHFVDYVFQRLQLTYTQEQIFRQGFTVRTTLDPNLQPLAEQALFSTVARFATNGVNTGGVLITDPRSGAIRAMVGSPNYNSEEIGGQFNTVLSYQQPGSAIKPVVYAATLENINNQYYTPATILWDVPTNYADGTPVRNFDNRLHGPVTLRSALQNSYNIPAVKAYVFAGDERFRDTAERMGLRFQQEAVFGPPTGVGATEIRPIDLVQAYGAIANDGLRIPLYAIEEITDSKGNVIPTPELPEPTQAISPQIAYLLQNIMSDDVSRQPAFGGNTRLAFPEFPGQIAAKTGTSSDNRDLWTVGFTNGQVVGVWLGRHDDSPIFNLSGYQSASTLWNQLMRQALQRDIAGEFNIPPNVVVRPVCELTGELVDPTGVTSCPSNVRNEYFIDAQLPTGAFIQEVQINTWMNQLADPTFCPNDIQTVRVANIIDGGAVAWLNTNAEGQAIAELLGLTIPVAEYPQSACDINTPVLNASITSPGQGETVTSVQVPIQGIIGGISNVARYELQVALVGTDDYNIVYSGEGGIPNTNTQLGVWDASTFANGTYDIRLSIYSTSDGLCLSDNNH